MHTSEVARPQHHGLEASQVDCDGAGGCRDVSDYEKRPFARVYRSEPLLEHACHLLGLVCRQAEPDAVHVGDLGLAEPAGGRPVPARIAQVPCVPDGVWP